MATNEKKTITLTRQALTMMMKFRKLSFNKTYLIGNRDERRGTRERNRYSVHRIDRKIHRLAVRRC
jgi:hypothetical protein